MDRMPYIIRKIPIIHDSKFGKTRIKMPAIIAMMPTTVLLKLNVILNPLLMIETKLAQVSVTVNTIR